MVNYSDGVGLLADCAGRELFEINVCGAELGVASMVRPWW